MGRSNKTVAAAISSCQAVGYGICKLGSFDGDLGFRSGLLDIFLSLNLPS